MLSMARKGCSEELSASGGRPVRDDAGARVRGIARDLGIMRGALRRWLAR